MEAAEVVNGMDPGPASLDILVVEHHPAVARCLRLYLEFHGHRVQMAGSLQAARNALARGGFHVLLTDVCLPDGSCFSLRGTSSLPPLVITMSAFDWGKYVERFNGTPKWPHLVKPFAVEELDALLDQFPGERDVTTNLIASESEPSLAP